MCWPLNEPGMSLFHQAILSGRYNAVKAGAIWPSVCGFLVIAFEGAEVHPRAIYISAW